MFLDKSPFFKKGLLLILEMFSRAGLSDERQAREWKFAASARKDAAAEQKGSCADLSQGMYFF